MSYEKTDAAANKKDSHGTTVSLVAGFVGVLVIISFLAYKSGVDPKKLKADVASFQEEMKELYAPAGIDVALNYTQIEAEGGLFEKSITLSEPSLSIKTSKVSYTLASSTAVIVPSDDHYHEFTVQLASPVTVHYGNSSRVAQLVSAKPISIALLKHKEDGKYYYQMPLHEQFALKVSEGGAEKVYDVTTKVGGKEPESYVLGSFLYGDMKQYEVTAQLTEATVTHEQQVTRFAEGTYIYSLDNAQELSEVHVGDVTSDLIPASLAPLALDVIQRAEIQDAGARRVVDIEQMKLSGTGFSVDVGGDVTLLDTELLPLAQVHVSAQGATTLLDALGTANILPANIKELMVTSLKRIAPSWNGKAEMPLEFALVRTADAPFMIGAVKADELFAMLFQHYFMMQQKAMQGEVTPPAAQGQDTSVTSEPAAPAVAPESVPSVDGAPIVAPEVVPAPVEVAPEAKATPATEAPKTEAPKTEANAPAAEQAVTPEHAH